MNKIIKKINVDKIRGFWQEIKIDEDNIVGIVASGGDDTVESIKLVAYKVNEIINWINQK